MKKYSWKRGAHYRGDAQATGEALDRILHERGELVAETVVEEARPKESPLHPHFEWNDKTAAQEFRKTQARDLIRAVEVVYTDSHQALQEPFRAFVHVGNPHKGEGSYFETVSAHTDEETSIRIMQQATRAVFEAKRVLATQLRVAGAVKSMSAEQVHLLQEAEAYVASWLERVSESTAA